MFIQCVYWNSLFYMYLDLVLKTKINNSCNYDVCYDIQYEIYISFRSTSKFAIFGIYIVDHISCSIIFIRSNSIYKNKAKSIR